MKKQDEATEKNVEGVKSTGKQGIEVELKKLEEEIKDDEDDNRTLETKNESKGEMTNLLSHFITAKHLITV